MKFDVDEMLRYFAVGIFFILLLYINMDDLLLLQQTETLNKVSSSSLWLLGGCLLSGFFIYAIYRSILYPLVNFLVTLFVRKRWRSTFPEYADLKVAEIRDQVDLLRMEMKSDAFKRCLSHWASHVHFLYNSAFVCWYYAVLSISLVSWCKKELSYVWLVIGGIMLFLISLYYHFRYKKFEMKLIQTDLKKTISEQEAQ